MKKKVSFLFIFILCLIVSAGAENDTVEISCAEDLSLLAENPYGVFVLANDIDMESLCWEPIPFYGILNGNGYSLYNLNIETVGLVHGVAVDGNNKQYSTSFSGLFSVLDGALVEDLNVSGATVTINTNDHCFAAILAGMINNSSIRNCRVDGSVYLESGGVMTGVGGIAGFGSGSFTNCNAEVYLTFVDKNTRFRCEQFMGGVLACGCADIMDCTISIRGFDSCNGYVHNGGLVGMYYKYSMEVTTGNVDRNNVYGQISFFENNPDRRAYCESLIGEPLSWPKTMELNNASFRRDEVWDYSTVLLPCQHQKAILTTNKTCSSWGYSDYDCSICDYHIRKDYKSPSHNEGEWEIISVADYGTEGYMLKKCNDCGQILDELREPSKVSVSEIRLNVESTSLSVGNSYSLYAEVFPQNADNLHVIWESTAPEIAHVDENGHVTALDKGEANIICRSADGFSYSSCRIDVYYTAKQWFWHILSLKWMFK